MKGQIHSTSNVSMCMYVMYLLSFLFHTSSKPILADNIILQINVVLISYDDINV